MRSSAEWLRHPQSHHPSELARWLILAPVVLIMLLGCGQLALWGVAPVVYVDSRSKLRADYGAWPIVAIQPISPNIVTEVHRDQTQFPEAPESEMPAESSSFGPPSPSSQPTREAPVAPPASLPREMPAATELLEPTSLPIQKATFANPPTPTATPIVTHPSKPVPTDTPTPCKPAKKCSAASPPTDTPPAPRQTHEPGPTPTPCKPAKKCPPPPSPEP